jgi:pilus assembly protein Flp/PilA
MSAAASKARPREAHARNLPATADETRQGGVFFLTGDFVMKAFATGIRNFLKDEEGANAIEYALIAALISVVIIASATAVGEAIQAVFEFVAGALEAPLGGGGGADPL